MAKSRGLLRSGWTSDRPNRSVGSVRHADFGCPAGVAESQSLSRRRLSVRDRPGSTGAERPPAQVRVGTGDVLQKGRACIPADRPCSVPVSNGAIDPSGARASSCGGTAAATSPKRLRNEAPRLTGGRSWAEDLVLGRPSFERIRANRQYGFAPCMPDRSIVAPSCRLPQGDRHGLVEPGEDR